MPAAQEGAEAGSEQAQQREMLELELQRIMAQSEQLLEGGQEAVALTVEEANEEEGGDEERGEEKVVDADADDDDAGSYYSVESRAVRAHGPPFDSQEGGRPAPQTPHVRAARQALDTMPPGCKPLDERKSWFIMYVQDQIQKLKIRTNILRFKYGSYKQWFDGYNIAILLLSALLTLIEAMRAQFDVNVGGMDTPTEIGFGVTPIVISSVVTVASALVKFKRYESRMQDLQSAIQQAIYTIYRLKRIQETTKHLSTDEELTTLVQMYSEDVYKEYIECLSTMERNLRYEDLVKHMKTYFALSLEYERSELNYRLERLLLSATQQLREGDVDEEAEGVRRRHRKNRVASCPERVLPCCFPPPGPPPDQSDRTRSGARP